MSKIPTPTLDAMCACNGESQAIGNFVEWLHENKMYIAKYGNNTQLFEIDESIEQLLARYFEIDLRAAESERRAILQSLRP